MLFQQFNFEPKFHNFCYFLILAFSLSFFVIKSLFILWLFTLFLITFNTSNGLVENNMNDIVFSKLCFLGFPQMTEETNEVFFKIF